MGDYTMPFTPVAFVDESDDFDGADDADDSEDDVDGDASPSGTNEMST